MRQNCYLQSQDFFIASIVASKYQLLYYKSKGYKYVKILSAANACDECYPLDNKKYEIDKALELMPIPNRKCTNSQYDYENEEDLIGFCRCLWHPYDPQLEKYERQL